MHTDVAAKVIFIIELPENAPAPIVITEFGIIILVKPVEAKALTSISEHIEPVTNVADVKNVHPLNAYDPIVVTVLGIIILGNLEHD